MKAGDAVVCSASGTQSREGSREATPELAGSDARQPWWWCHGKWLVARGVMRTVTRSSSSKTAVGVSTEGSQQCKRSILQRVLGARNRDPTAAGDARQTGKPSARR